MTFPPAMQFSEPVRFTDPVWLAAGLGACLLLLWLWRVYDRRQHAALAGFVSAHLRQELTQSLSTGRRRVQRALYLVALACLFIALAGPEWGFHWEQINRRGNEIVFAIDTSRSMSTPDVKPNRLTRAKLAIDDFTKRLEGDAVGIVAFAGSAFLVCPITLDYGAFRESLSAIDTGTIPLGGTNITSAIAEAQAALRRRPGSDKILILVTDGEDLEGDALVAAQSAAREDSLKIYTVGVGTAAGDLIPLPPDQGGGFVKDPDGAFVKSHLDESGLKAIAAATGGFYVPLGVQGEGLDTIFTNVLGSIAKHDLASRQQKIYTPRFQWPLAASLAALLSSLLVGNRRRLGARKRINARTAATVATVATAATVAPVTSSTRATGAMGAAALGVVFVACSILPRAQAAAPDAQPQLEYNAGTAAYRAGKFPQAEKAFQQSITHAPSSDPQRLADQEDAYYNLGNTLYRTGQKTAKSSPDETIKKWNDAIKAYETALQLRADDADSKYNRDLVKRKIEELKQQQNQQNPQDKNQKNPQPNQGKGQGGQGQGQGQGQPNQGQPNQGQPNQGQPGQQGQPPPQEAKNSDPKQGHGQPPPPSQSPPGAKPDQPKGPPPGSQDPQQQNAAPKSNQAPQAAPQEPGTDAAQSAQDAEREADNQHAPGEMSREEARELLDSAKSDERHAMGAPLARREDDHQQRPPAKDW